MEFAVGRLFTIMVWNLLLLSLIYFMTAILSVSQLNPTDPSIVIFGFVSLLGIFAFPFGYVGALKNLPQLILFFIVMVTSILTTTITYLMLYAFIVESNFRYYPLHHSFIFTYFVVNLISLLFGSILLISSVKKVDVISKSKSKFKSK